MIKSQPNDRKSDTFFFFAERKSDNLMIEKVNNNLLIEKVTAIIK